jgi:hypothetical protein
MGYIADHKAFDMKVATMAHNGATISEIAREFNSCDKTVHVSLKRSIENGLLKKVQYRFAQHAQLAQHAQPISCDRCYEIDIRTDGALLSTEEHRSILTKYPPHPLCHHCNPHCNVR